MASNQKQIQDDLIYRKALVSKILTIPEYEYEIEHLDKIGVFPWCTLKSGKKWPLKKRCFAFFYIWAILKFHYLALMPFLSK